MKTLAVDLEVFVMMVAKINRESRSDLNNPGERKETSC